MQSAEIAKKLAGTPASNMTATEKEYVGAASVRAKEMSVLLESLRPSEVNNLDELLKPSVAEKLGGSMKILLGRFRGKK